MDIHVALTLQLGESVLTHDQLAGVFNPVLAECGLHRMHDRAAHPHAQIAHVLLVLRIPEPAIDNAMTTDEGNTAIEHDDLAMIALVEHANVAPLPRVVQREFAAG